MGLGEEEQYDDIINVFECITNSSGIGINPGFDFGEQLHVAHRYDKLCLQVEAYTWWVKRVIVNFYEVYNTHMGYPYRVLFITYLVE
jgi:hypothetical protein